MWGSFVVVLAGLQINPEFTVPPSSDRVSQNQYSNRRRRITRSVRQDVVRLYETGQSALEVAETVGIGKSTVLRILKQEGAVVRRQGERRT